eukprot:30389-Eustigmatos_ZCMA.PRE.1
MKGGGGSIGRYAAVVQAYERKPLRASTIRANAAQDMMYSTGLRMYVTECSWFGLPRLDVLT